MIFTFFEEFISLTWAAQHQKEQRKKLLARIKASSRSFPVDLLIPVMVVGMERAGSILEGRQLLQPLSGHLSGAKLVWFWEALICLCHKSRDVPPLQAVTAKACLLAVDTVTLVISTLSFWRQMALFWGEPLARSFAWEGAPAWLRHLQDNLTQAVGRAPPGAPPPSLSCLTTYIWCKKATSQKTL